ncbi:probable terpene synthase 6 [Tripterygium wilfordii]|uniref:probable terpene synthase 6 n=1 Tax=Tripterygium wilfordii TaxID=458696 RepID=UPI0018F7E69D|nr:probable terpene synthase 6 [Tripterygium wilfordii]
MAMASKSQPADALRPLVNFPWSPWSAEYLASLCPSDSELGFYTKRVDELKSRVKAMLMDSTYDAVEKVKLIDLLCRLGVSYHFENEIEDQLAQIFNSKAIDVREQHDYDLYTITLLFRVFRQHGYKISCEVFNKFKGDDGELERTLSSDVKGMLSLYEAAHLRVHGEDILDEALDYKITNLDFMKSQVGLIWLESMKYISFYEEEESHNEMLIKLAKLDFNHVQLLHQQELVEVARWYKDAQIEYEYSYARQRIAECYLWAMGASFEPQYACIRTSPQKQYSRFQSQTIHMMHMVRLANSNNIQMQFKNGTQGAIHQLPDYMKSLYKIILDVYDELESNLQSKERSYWVSYAKDTVKQLVKAYDVEVEWCNKNYVPSFEEYIENALISSGYRAVSVLCFVGMEEFAGMKDEKKRSQHVSTSIECYMKQYKILSKEEAIKSLKKKIKDLWKDINKECMGPTALSRPLFIPFLNLARVMDVFYKHKDEYTDCVILKGFIKSLFIEGIPIEE